MLRISRSVSPYIRLYALQSANDFSGIALYCER